MDKRKYKMKNIFLILALYTAFLSCEKSKNLPASYDCVTPHLVQSGILVGLSVLISKFFRSCN